jgi:hypothetical protein
MATYTALVVRSGRWWAIRIAELPGIYSQARKSRDIAALAREATAMTLDVPEKDIAIRKRFVSWQQWETE